jgi:hypothetical protein
MDSGWVTVEEAARWDAISLKQAKRRSLGQCAPNYISRLEPDSSGRMRRMVSAASLSLAGQKRRSDAQIAALIDPPAAASEPQIADSRLQIPDRPGQLSLIPETEEDKVIEAVKLKLRPSQVSDTLARYRALKPLVSFQPTMNHDFAALGIPGKVEYSKRIAAQFGMSLRHYQRLKQKYVETLQEKGPEAAIESLALNSPGPAKWTGSPLDPRTPEGQSNIAFIQNCWEKLHLTRRQTYNEIVKYLEAKQKGTGPGWIYTVPTEQAVYTFINRKPPHGLNGDDNPRRNGAEAIKIAAGYIDCTYDDEPANATWCIDEWELDGAFYNVEKHSDIWWSLYMVSVIDERTTRILDWTLAYRLNVETVLDLLERCVRTYGPPLYLRSDEGSHFRSRVLSHKAPSSRHDPVVVQSHGKLLDAALGAMGQLGTQPVSPEGHNPRSNRIERMHGIYAERAQQDFGPSWRGSPKKEVSPGVSERTMSGIDERVARHLKEHCKLGTSGPLLLSTDDAERIVANWVEEINLADTEAKGCKGMSRLAAYNAFVGTNIVRPTPHMIDLAFAEHAEETIKPGGIVQWRDGLRYWSSALIGHPGEIVPMLRYRRDTSKILVDLDGELVTAERRAIVGRNTPELLEQESERQASTVKGIREGRLAAPAISNFKSQISDPEFEQPEATHGDKALNKANDHYRNASVEPANNPAPIATPPADFSVEESRVEESSSSEPTDHPSLGSVEYLMEGARPIPSLHELEEFDPTEMEEM